MLIRLHNSTRGETRTRNLPLRSLRREASSPVGHTSSCAPPCGTSQDAPRKRVDRLTSDALAWLFDHRHQCTYCSGIMHASRACGPGSTPGARTCPMQVRVLPGSYQMTHPACAMLSYHSRGRRSQHRACVRGGHPTGCCEYVLWHRLATYVKMRALCMGRNPACVREHLTSNKDKKGCSGNGTRDRAHLK